MKKSMLLLIVLLGTARVLVAEQSLTWEECLRQTKEHNPDVIAALENVKQAEAARRISRSGYFPQLDGSASAQVSKSEQSSDKQAFSSGGISQEGDDTNESYSLSLSARQLLFDSFKSKNTVAATEENVKSSRYAYAVSSSNIRLRLRRAFVNLLKAQQLQIISGEIAQRRKQNLELVSLRYEAGREHKGSLLTAQADLANAEFEVAQAERASAIAQRQLMAEMGKQTYEPLKVVGELSVASRLEQITDFEKMAEETPFLLEVIARKEAARFNLLSTKAEAYPNVYASASVGRNDTDFPPENTRWSAVVTMNIPLFSGGSRTATLERSSSQLRKAAADERGARNSVLLTLAQTWVDFQNAVEQIGVQEKFFSAAQERARIAEAQYKAGLLTFDNWIIIEDTIIRTKKSLLDAQANALLAEASWQQAKGVTLHD